VLLGKHNTAASRQEYKRVVVEWEANARQLAGATASDMTVAELIERHWRHVEDYYKHLDGTATGEVQAMRYALRPLNYLHGKMIAGTFGPIALKAVRELMIRGYTHPKFGEQKPACRTQVNARVKRIRRMFKWAVEEEIVPPSVLQGLQAVAALKAGRSEARESRPVRPVARAVVEDTLPLLRPIMADMVRLQLETGMRPGELVVMRACDIDMTGAGWHYRPAAHKTAHHGHERIVAIGPKAQEIIRRHLTTDLTAFLFSPKLLMQERAATMRENRKTKVQPSQVNRKKAKRKRPPGNVYTVTAYSQAIRIAIRRHNKKAQASEQIPHWHPHQLRHTRAMELKRAAGLDVARAVLGQRSPVITEHYATLDLAKATEVMTNIG
jgi:integrase